MISITLFTLMLATIAAADNIDLKCSNNPSEWCSNYRMARACNVFLLILISFVS